MVKLELHLLTERRDKFFKKAGMPLVVILFLLKSYLSLYLRDIDYISHINWEDIHVCFECVCLILLIQTVKSYIKEDFINRLFYSIGMAVFTGRLINQFIFHSFEVWYETLSIIILTVIAVVTVWIKKK